MNNSLIYILGLDLKVHVTVEILTMLQLFIIFWIIMFLKENYISVINVIQLITFMVVIQYQGHGRKNWNIFLIKKVISLHYVHNSLKGIIFIYLLLSAKMVYCVELIKNINFVQNLKFVLFMILGLVILQKMP